MKKNSEDIIAWGMALLPLVFGLLAYNNLIKDPSTKMARSNGVVLNKPGYMVLIAISCLLFYFATDVLTASLKQFVPEKYSRHIRFTLLTLFTALNIIGIVGNLKGLG